MSAKYDKLRDILKGLNSVLVAFSGGVDSSVLLAAANETLKDKCLAVTFVSPLGTKEEKSAALKIAKIIGAKHEFIETDELNLADFKKNPADRCYVCKKHKFLILKDMAKKGGFAAVLEGSNADDLSDFRPGMKAISELGIRSPLCEAGLSKDEIRLLAKKFGLPVWDKPANPCLVTRIPVGAPITQKKLRRIEESEKLIKSFGFKMCRVRDFGDYASLEVESADIEKLKALMCKIEPKLRTLRYLKVFINEDGYKKGQMNSLDDKKPADRKLR